MSRSSSSSPLRSPLDARLRQADLHDLFERQRSEEHTSELQSRLHLVCRLLLEKNKLFGKQDRELEQFSDRTERIRDIGVSSPMYARGLFVPLGLARSFGTSSALLRDGTHEIFS